MTIEEKNGELTITDFNELEAYVIAGRIEEDGIAFYTALASVEKDPEARKAFEFLADQEREHRAFFQKCEARMRERMEVDNREFEEDDLLSEIDYGIFDFFLDTETIASLAADLPRSLRLAIEVEKRSVAFYNECRKQVSLDTVQDSLTRIIGEEEAHRRRFEALLHSVER